MCIFLHVSGYTYCHGELFSTTGKNAQLWVCAAFIWTYSHNKEDNVHQQAIAQRTLRQQTFQKGFSDFLYCCVFLL